MKYLIGHSGEYDYLFGKLPGSDHVLPYNSLKSATSKIKSTLQLPEGSGTVYKLVPVYVVPGKVKL